MSKYIINNCPALFLTGVCAEKQLTYCEDRADCLLKQIVELCKKIIFLNRGTDFTDVDMYKHAVGENFVAKQVLQLLDIQEVE